MAITNGLITLDDARKSLGWAAADTANNDDLERYIEAITPLVENVVGPVLPRSATYRFDGGSAAVTLPSPFLSLTSVTVGGVLVTGCVADCKAGIVYANTAVFTDGLRNIAVTVQEGMATVPPNILLAVRETVRILWQQGRQGNRPGFGNTADAEIAPQWGTFALPRRAVELLAPHARVGGFA